jgi:hypothetical protein
MNIRSVAILALGASGCESEEQVAADMERALQDSHEAMVEVLLSTEVLSHLLEAPGTTLRHGGPGCGCPCYEQIGVGLPSILSLDYDLNGCIPSSGRLPSLLAGHAVLEFDGSEAGVTWDSLSLGLDQAVSGSLSGTVEPGVLSPTGTLTIGERETDFALTVELGDPLRIEGEVTAQVDDPRILQLTEVELSLGSLVNCVSPTSGTATLVHPKRERKSTVVRFGEGGQTVVERDGRTSQPTDGCRYASARW